MSSKSRKKVEKILDELCDYENVENYNQLAPLLHYNSGAVYKWVKRGSIPVHKLSEKRPDLNKEFLIGKDAPIANENFLKGSNLNSLNAKAINKDMEKLLSSNGNAEHDSPLERILLSFRSQLIAQKNQTETMLHYIEMILKLRSD